jgi:cysteine-rich repeat protein
MTPTQSTDGGQDAGGGDAGHDAGGADAGQDAGDPCDGLLDGCKTKSVECVGDILVTCKKNDDGCLVETRTNCLDVGANNACDGTLATPDCAYDPCKDEFGAAKPDACVVPETTCQGTVLVTCEDDDDGCPIANRTQCKTEPSKNTCNDAVDPPVCWFDPCIGVTNCLAAGLSCRGTDLVDCQPKVDNCLVEAVTDCTNVGTEMKTCIPGAPPACGACADDAACTTAPECTGNVHKSCSDTDGDMCLNLVSEDCGASFTCDMTDGCEYSGGETCDKMPVTGTLRAPGTYGSPYNTTGGMSDFGSYPCPGLLALFPFVAAAPDHLFAVDVAPGTVVTVAFAVKYAAAWMVLLTDCSDAAGMSAESSCVDMSQTSITYANDATTTQRVYVVVDADGGGSVGMYGLTVDVRPLACGDGNLDGGEACDDGNIFAGDGCKPDCTLEPEYECTQASPSVCSRRPADGVCGNVMCPELPASPPAPNGAERCCTPDEKCGIAYPTYYGAGCFEEGMDEGVDQDPPCVDEPAGFLGFPTIQGCCRPDDQCGVLLDTAGIGCVERTQFHLYSQDGLANVIYATPDAIACTHP